MNLKGTRALVVEDDSLIAMMIEQFLQELGCLVVATAALLPEAVEKASSIAMDVAILDLNLAGDLSYPVAEILQARGIPYLFATGYGRAGPPVHLKPVAILPKPFAIQQLQKVLERIA